MDECGLVGLRRVNGSEWGLWREGGEGSEWSERGEGVGGGE